MIKPITMQVCFCDGCGKQWADSHTGFFGSEHEKSIKEGVSNDTLWVNTTDGHHFCPDCCEYNDKGELTIKVSSIEEGQYLMGIDDEIVSASIVYKTTPEKDNPQHIGTIPSHEEITSHECVGFHFLSSAPVYKMPSGKCYWWDAVRKIVKFCYEAEIKG